MLSPVTVRYRDNGSRAVGVEETLEKVEGFFLGSPVEVQLRSHRRDFGHPDRVVLERLDPIPEDGCAVAFGKGFSRAQSSASACLEFIERLNARMTPYDEVIAATYNDVDDSAIDPEMLCLAKNSQYSPDRVIDYGCGDIR